MKPKALSRADVVALEKKGKRTALENRLVAQIKAAGLPVPMREAYLIPLRLWRWDLAWGHPQCLAVEVQGGTWMPTRGAHSRGAGQRRDAEKQNAAVLAGWRCLVVTSDMVRDGSALATIQEALK